MFEGVGGGVGLAGDVGAAVLLAEAGEVGTAAAWTPEWTAVGRRRRSAQCLEVVGVLAFTGWAGRQASHAAGRVRVRFAGARRRRAGGLVGSDLDGYVPASSRGGRCGCRSKTTCGTPTSCCAGSTTRRRRRHDRPARRRPAVQPRPDQPSRCDSNLGDHLRLVGQNRQVPVSIPALVEPSVLRWARETIELSPVAASRKLDLPDDRVAAWEAGEVQLTIAQR